MDGVSIALIVIAVVIIVIILCILIFGTSSCTIYYQYPTDQHVQLGEFGTDPVVSSTRYFTTYSDSGLTQSNGNMQTQIDYTAYPLNNQMYMNKIINLNVNGVLTTISVTYAYTADPAAKPAIYDFTNSYVLGSTNTGFIGRKVSITNVSGDTYKLSF